MNLDQKIEALICASTEGNLSVVETLLLDPALSVNSYRQTNAMISASYEGHLELVKYLHQCGAELECRDESGDTALIGAVFGGHETVVEFLLSIGADVTLKDAENKWNVVEWALYENHDQVLEILFGHPTCRDLARDMLTERNSRLTPSRARRILKSLARWRNSVKTTFLLPSIEAHRCNGRCSLLERQELKNETVHTPLCSFFHHELYDSALLPLIFQFIFEDESSSSSTNSSLALTIGIHSNLRSETKTPSLSTLGVEAFSSPLRPPGTQTHETPESNALMVPTASTAIKRPRISSSGSRR